MTDLLISDIRLRKFCDAVRAKDKWVFKIGALGEKWAEEAQLIRPTEKVDERVLHTLWELRAEANRIRAVDYEIQVHSLSLPERPIDFAKISDDVKLSLKYARSSKYGLRQPELRDSIGIFVSDGLVPPSLHRELVAGLDALASLEPKDFHPGTYGKVQDLIHPSLYPYIANASPLNPSATPPPLHNGKFTTSVATDNQTLDHSSLYAWIPSVFTVSEDGKDVSIDSYINGLGPRERFPSLYRIIEKTFLCALPHFEKTLNATFVRGNSDSIDRWKARAEKRNRTSLKDWNALLEEQKTEKAQMMAEKANEEKRATSQIRSEWEERPMSVEENDKDIQTSFKGRSLKVIVKAANYILKPGQTYEGSWHLEGMPHERIVASAIFYYDHNEFIRDNGLSFRRARSEEADFPSIYDYTHEDFFVHVLKEKPKTENSKEGVAGETDGGDTDDESIDYDGGLTDYPSDWADDYDHVQLGTVTTTYTEATQPAMGHGTGRIISFPNWIQHKVMGISHADPSACSTLTPALRKILCFFLVNDSDIANNVNEYPCLTYSGLRGMHVLSTADVPEQRRGTNVPTLYILLPLACQAVTGRTLPPELVNLIVGSADLGLTREQAEKHRRQFMEDRKVKLSKENDIFDSNYSLCEH